MTDNPLDKKPDRDEILSYKHVLFEQVGEIMASTDKHILDVLYDLGVPRQLFLANLNVPMIREWWEASRERPLIHGLETGLRDMEMIKERSAMGLTMAGLDEKLAIMAALADPTTEQGRETILKLADYRAKLLPRTQKLEKPQESVEDAELREELKKIRAQREELLRQQDAARDANFSVAEDGE